MTEVDTRRVERAAAHIMGKPSPVAHFRDGVTHLQMARLMESLEAGVILLRSGHGRWYAPTGSPLGRNVSPVVMEAIRTGLVINVPYGSLVPAKVHAAAWNDDQWRTVCHEPGEGKGPKRVRMHRDPIYVDCLACLARL